MHERFLNRSNKIYVTLSTDVFKAEICVFITCDTTKCDWSSEMNTCTGVRKTFQQNDCSGEIVELLNITDAKASCLSKCCTCLHPDTAHTLFQPQAHTSTQTYTSAVVLRCLYLLDWVCSCSSTRRIAGQSCGGACWSWRVDSICIWHTDCTKYANRQTMTFAVLFFL